MATPENEVSTPEKERPYALTPAQCQPSALFEDEKDREWGRTCAGGFVWKADEGTVALVEAVLLPEGSAPPPWLDDTGMQFIGWLKEHADKYIQAQRKARAAKKSRPARKGLKLVQGGRHA